MSVTPDPIKRGAPISAKALNENTRATQQSVQVAGGLEKRHVGRSLTLRPLDTSAPPREVQSIKTAIIKEVFEDYLRCNFYNAMTSAELTTREVYVAKERQFRPSSYDGATVVYGNGDSITYTKDATNPEWKRQADDGVSSEDQVVLPTWYVGEVIDIIQMQTGVTVTIDGTDVPIKWRDITNRAWAAVEL